MADQRIFFPSQPLLPADNHSSARSTLNRRNQQEDFASILSNMTGKGRVAFSQHAQARMQERQLSFDDAQLAQLDDTVSRLAQKGAREALIYLNDIALVVSVTNRTVITAMDGTSAKDNLFMNIDSAAII